MNYKTEIFSGAGNKFVMVDGRGEFASPSAQDVVQLCEDNATDGLIVLRSAPDGAGFDFVMEFFNPDASCGMMCGNGGRCIVAFARELGVTGGGRCRFLAPDGMHVAEILSGQEGRWSVRLGMKDVREAVRMQVAGVRGWFLDTGARHFVVTDESVCAAIGELDVMEKGKALRWEDAFAPMGANIDFVRRNADSSLTVRTFEKGVEGETLACGTGITASAIAANLEWGVVPGSTVHAREADLRVDFKPDGTGAREVFLTGPVEKL